jgi:hypothetical protein
VLLDQVRVSVAAAWSAASLTASGEAHDTGSGMGQLQAQTGEPSHCRLGP